MENICPTGNDSTYCFTTPYTFDVSTTEIYGWINGGRIAIANIASYQDFKNFPNFAKEMKVTHFAISPSGFVNMLRVYNSEEIDKLVCNVKYLMSGIKEIGNLDYLIYMVLQKQLFMHYTMN